VANYNNEGQGRIDVHVHAIPPFYTEAVTAAGHKASVSAGYPDWTPDSALAFMDRNNIDVSINSISPPGVHFGDDAKASTLARRCNDFLGQLCALYPTRFGALGILPLPSVKASLLEIDHIFGELKLDGAVLFASYGTAFIGDAVFDPVLESLNEVDAVVFIHPNSHPSSLALGMQIPTFLVEFPLATTRVVANLIFSGALERYPRIKFILAHNGGAIPYLSWRLAMAPLIDQRFHGFSQQGVLDALKRFYFESAQAAGPAPMAALAEISSPEHWLFGSDWPYCPESVTKAGDESLDASGIATGAFRNNALRLFKRLSQLKPA
jgi:predicted TIM-barrel fold metal-dependent hydrolase